MLDAYYLDLFLRVVVICLVLTGIHGYLGIHVIERQVIFVDLAMAQIAALGATYALLLGYDPTHDPADAAVTYAFSLSFTLLGAALFALTRVRHERIPQEAIIGIVYAAASALAILILTKSPTAGEQIKHMLVGNILLVSWSTVAKTAAIYAVIGWFHWRFRRQFLFLTFDPSDAERAGMRIRLWDFLFYMTFGIVITSSVAIAGVLLVFSFLVVPAAVGVLFSSSTAARITIGWAVGTLVSVIGALFSFWADVPAGPAVVACFAAVLTLAAVGRFIVQSASPLAAVARVSAIAGVVVLGARASTYLAKAPDVHEHGSEIEQIAAALRAESESRQIDALHHVHDHPDPHLLTAVLEVLKTAESDRVVEHAVQAVTVFQDQAAIPALRRVAATRRDPFLRVEIARAIFELGSPAGIPILLALLEEEPPVVVRQEAIGLLDRFTGRTLGYDPQAGAAQNREALLRWRQLWQESGHRLRWRKQTRRFE